MAPNKAERVAKGHICPRCLGDREIILIGGWPFRRTKIIPCPHCLQENTDAQ
jgi:hypothetical protein